MRRACSGRGRTEAPLLHAAVPTRRRRGRRRPVWLYGGHDANGPVATVQRGDLGTEAAEGLPENPDEGKVVEWAVNPAQPAGAARRRGRLDRQRLALSRRWQDADGPAAQELYWSIPTGDGDIPEWKQLEVSDLPYGLAGGTLDRDGPERDHRRWRDGRGPRSRRAVRANTAPQTPFFQLGLVGATVPGLKIDGEIGQQLGYLNAAGAGTVNFIILLLIGWAFAHKEQARGPRSAGDAAAADRVRRRAGEVSREVALARVRACRGGPAGRPAPRHPCRRRR